jgi:hypothetical protein
MEKIKQLILKTVSEALIEDKQPLTVTVEPKQLPVLAKCGTKL